MAHASPDPNINMPCTAQGTMTYAAKQGVPANAEISINSSPGQLVFWTFPPTLTNCVKENGLLVHCVPIDTNQSAYFFKVTAPAGQVEPGASSNDRINISTSGPTLATNVSASGTFTVKATDAINGAPECSRDYTVHVTSEGGGWGDPHLTTVDGAHYDFQSAGEFTALREDRLEIQTRQTPVATTAVPGTSAYSGLTSCVAVYTAVAARIGASRVTLQPTISGVPDPTAMELRVNGNLVALTSDGIDLVSGGGSDSGEAKGAPPRIDGRIEKGDGDAIKITDASGTQLFVAPSYWAAHQQWYLNLNVYQTSATQGTMGRLAPDSWLPALPDGRSLGARPESLPQRYHDLFGTFADAWRVTKATSLFDYAPGTSTSTFTLAEWPYNNPQSCTIAGQASAKPTTQQAAQQACAAVTDPARKADCVFDVAATGNADFGKSYEAIERIQPHGPGWQDPLVPRPTSSGHGGRWLLLLLIVIGLALI